MSNVALQLEHYIEQYQKAGKSFDWVDANCCLFVNSWVKLLTGEDHMKSLPRTKSRLQAHRLVKILGEDLKGATTRLLELDPFHINFAQTGDVVLVKAEGDTQLLGICDNRFVACLSAEGTVVRIEISNGVCAWRIGAKK